MVIRIQIKNTKMRTGFRGKDQNSFEVLESDRRESTRYCSYRAVTLKRYLINRFTGHPSTAHGCSYGEILQSEHV